MDFSDTSHDEAGIYRYEISGGVALTPGVSGRGYVISIMPFDRYDAGRDLQRADGSTTRMMETIKVPDDGSEAKALLALLLSAVKTPLKAQ